MASIEDYLDLLDISVCYELDCERKSLVEFDGVSAPVETGDREFYGWSLSQSCDGYNVVLTQDTPGDTKELNLEEFADRLETGEFIPTKRMKNGYLEADLK